jgi:dihydrofolate reductase
MEINCIVAHDLNYCIGKDGKMPWKNLKKDLRFFRQMTLNNVVVMGRKTFEALNSKPLPKRLNIVITSKNYSFKYQALELKHNNLIFVKNIPSMLRFVKPHEKIFIIGGGSLYDKFWDISNNIYTTIVNTQTKNGDTFIKPVNKHIYDCVNELEFEEEIDSNPEVLFLHYFRTYPYEFMQIK